MTVNLVTGGSSTTTKMGEPVEKEASTFQGISRKRTATSYDVPAYTDYNKSTPVLRKGTEEGQSNQPLTSMAENLTIILVTLCNGSTAEFKSKKQSIASFLFLT